MLVVYDDIFRSCIMQLLTRDDFGFFDVYVQIMPRQQRQIVEWLAQWQDITIEKLTVLMVPEEVQMSVNVKTCV